VRVPPPAGVGAADERVLGDVHERRRGARGERHVQPARGRRQRRPRPAAADERAEHRDRGVLPGDHVDEGHAGAHRVAAGSPLMLIHPRSACTTKS
jgi:hypothetical protein